MIKRHPAQQMQEGDGVNVFRLMPIAYFRNYDPFVLWDDFTITPGSGFPEHPHRGFEAVTYLFSGSMKHTDNLGNSSTVHTGGAQRFTAGRGIIHSEMPNEENQTRGIQLWINLPKRLKQTDADYQQVNHEEFPIAEIEGGQIKTIIGESSPLKLLTSVNYYDIQLNEGYSHHQNINENGRGLIYVVEGKIRINDQVYNKTESAFFEEESSIIVTAVENCRFMLCFGQPYGEPIIQYGPFVD